MGTTMLPEFVVDHSMDLLHELHTYILREYESLWDEYLHTKQKSVPSIYTIVRRTHNVLHHRIMSMLQDKYTCNSSSFDDEEDFQKVITMYSFWFDQQADGTTDILYHALCREMDKFFTLYQLFHDKDGQLMNEPILEVW